jgi:hypothetical protein
MLKDGSCMEKGKPALFHLPSSIFHPGRRLSAAREAVQKLLRDMLQGPASGCVG